MAIQWTVFLQPSLVGQHKPYKGCCKSDIIDILQCVLFLVYTESDNDSREVV